MLKIRKSFIKEALYNAFRFAINVGFVYFSNDVSCGEYVDSGGAWRWIYHAANM